MDELYPLLLPIFVMIGSTGALMIFSSDRDKGVYEYMLAYGVEVSTIFWSVIGATIGLVTLVLAVSLVVTVSAIAVTGGTLSLVSVELILLYTVPLSYASTVFMGMAGMVWSQLTARRPGVNSPLGIAPLLGIGPVLVVLLLAVGPGAGHILYIVGTASGAMLVAAASMGWIANGRMQRERFISSA